MKGIVLNGLVEDFLAHISQKEFPCIAAHDAASKDTIQFYIAEHMACPHDDVSILAFLYDFVDMYRGSAKGYHSAVILFKQPESVTEVLFEGLMWARLQALADLDAEQYPYDHRVSQDPDSPHFSFSLKSESFYIIGLHPANSRKARQYKLPALVFNPHAQFERLREHHIYHKMQHIVRQRDHQYSGSVNPMLTDFGEVSEAMQYSGKYYEAGWKCPLNLKHGTADHHTSS